MSSLVVKLHRDGLRGVWEDEADSFILGLENRIELAILVLWEFWFS